MHFSEKIVSLDRLEACFSATETKTDSSLKGRLIVRWERFAAFKAKNVKCVLRFEIHYWCFFRSLLFSLLSVVSLFLMCFFSILTFSSSLRYSLMTCVISLSQLSCQFKLTSSLNLFFTNSQISTSAFFFLKMIFFFFFFF